VRTRLAAKLQRKIKRKKKHGLYNPGDEVWMHVKPELDELRNWRRKMDCADSMNEEELQEETVETSSESGTPGQTSDEDKNDGLQTGSKEATDKNWLGHPPLLQEQAVEGTRDNSDMPSNGKAS
jgi:platelet-activating factor acetylhydrolase